ncbi:MAG: double-strand break repair protein AddB, partial [Pseudomonadota bacterium]
MSAFMASRLFSIPAHQPFATTLARALLDEVADDPRALSGLTILLPTRRAIIAMRAAFLAAAPGRALLLPTMVALGDVGEGDGAEDLTPSLLTGGGRVGEKPAIGELDRLSLLTTLVYRRLSQDRPLTDVPPLDQAARLADELARFMDRVQTAGLDFSGLETLVPNVGNLAEHWQQSLTFLEIVTKAWPHVLADHGCQDAAERRHRLMMTLAEAWREQPPNAPIIAAGSTGSIPATRNLLAVIASLPQGRVILPGLDKAADDREWQAIGQDPTHPQFGLAELLDAVGAERDAVTELADRPADDHHHRQHLLSLAMRPAKVSDVWAETALDPAASRGITLVDCEHAGEEASVIALILREALEHEGKTAALVTPDRSLAKRVASLVGRWGIAIDDSAGTPLSETPIGTYLRALAELGAQPRDAIAWMSLLKHPFARAGQSAAGFGQFVRGFDLALRDDRAGSPFSVLQEVGGPVARSIEQVLSPFFDALEGPARPLSDHLAVQMQVAEGLADDDARAGRDRLWADEDGEAAASFVDELSSALDRLPHADFANFAGLFETLLGGRVVRSARTTHPRLAIWGPLEARLQTADRVILGGLNEGTWPRDPAPDPWMSFDMQLTFGLAPP